MSDRNLEVSARINNTPEAVIGYVAEVRNRPLYLKQLKAVSDVQGGPGPGQTWKWTWAVLGLEFEGTGRCLKYEPGKVYSFRTEGGIASTWTYTARPDGDGTNLTVRVEYEVPDKAKATVPTGSAADSMKKTEAERVMQNLKAILDR